MNLNAATRRLKPGLDWGFIVGMVFALVLAGKIVPFLAVVGVVPIPFLWRSLQQKHYLVSPVRLIVPAAIYFVYMLLTYFFYTGLQPGDAKPVNPDIELYGIGIAILIVGTLRSHDSQPSRKRLKNSDFLIYENRVRQLEELRATPSRALGENFV